MMDPRVEVEAREVGATLEITIRGAADIAAASYLRERLLAVLASDRDVVVRLDAVERLDGAGVQILLSAKSFVEHGGRTLVVTTAGEVALRAMESAGVLALLAPLGISRAHD